MGAYGGIPTVPDPTDTARQAISGGISSLSDLYSLGTGLSNITAAEARNQYEQNLPGYGALTSKASSNIGEDLAGTLPADVVALLQSSAAERGVSTGSPDSPNSNAAYLRAMGLTSLGRKDLGQQELTAAIGRTPTGPLFNPASMLVTPDQQQAAAAAQDLYNSAPNPFLAAQERKRLALEGLGAGAGSIGGAPGISRTRADPFSFGPGFTGGGGTRGGTGGLDMSPEAIANWANFESDYWDPMSLSAPPTPDWVSSEQDYWDPNSLQAPPTPDWVNQEQQYWDPNF